MRRFVGIAAVAGIIVVGCSSSELPTEQVGHDQQALGPCVADGLCIPCLGTDPDCPVSGPLAAGWVDTTCGGRLWARAEDSSLGLAVGTVRAKYPNVDAAQAATDPHFFDAHPSGFGTGHAELQGFGVTFVSGTWPDPAFATGPLSKPSLLFFQKTSGAQSTWKIIGMGYDFDFQTCTRPTQTTIDKSLYFVHEAGYHLVGSTGGFQCATNDDIKTSGLTVDSNVCNEIEDADLKNRWPSKVRHGRAWVVHVWFEPGTDRPVLATTDPWCRQSTSAISVPSCGFKDQGDCGCD